ncbi:DivIVA domain-containing protein [Streptomyces sp. YC504]|uniref:Cell wall synthesis protein Wag31 n=1 Tax=Streptomyces mesophilus TaxID=1775132 RepID=A0A6G4XMF3_9ACTN|nr:DivIVA domain-containing protein [Streptomyces mesophilus]NGO77884.1 DivIVA domain-containing protein [Streptomyces mesophilus]
MNEHEVAERALSEHKVNAHEVNAHDVIDRHPEVPGQQRPLLTPDDVHHKWFTTTRLREGYDLGEVDTFLQDVEYTLAHLHRDNADLRRRHPAPADTGHDAARIIALADRTAGQAIAAACAEAQRIIDEARAKAGHLEQEATARAAQASAHAEQAAADHLHTLDREIRAKRSELEALTSSRLTLERQLTGLRTLLADYRSRVTVHFDDHLEDLERQTEQYLGSAWPSVERGG